MTRRPISEGLLDGIDDEPTLIGSRCADCRIVTVPRQGSGPRCASIAMDDHQLARRGTLWAWTTQDFAPPSPPYAGPIGKDFVPFAVGYVDLGGEVKVEGRLTVSDPAAIAHGMAMDLVGVPFGFDDDGTEVVTFAFAPSRDGAEV